MVNTSGPFGHEPIGVPFVDARHRAASADVPRVTLLQPTTYLENLSAPWSTVAEGVVAYPRPADAVLQWVATEDVALTVVRVLEEGIDRPLRPPGAGAHGTELAAALTEALEREVRYEAAHAGRVRRAPAPALGEHAAAGTAARLRVPAGALAAEHARRAGRRAGVTAWARETFPLGVAV